MAGTSLDGVDITCTEYTLEENVWNFHLQFCKTYKYSEEIFLNVKNAVQLSSIEMIQLDKKLGKIFGEYVLTFLEDFSINKAHIHAIASHGHTIYHQPEKGFTYQIGCGTTISLLSGLPVINDFRTKDVLLGGQGAPLVPVGDQKLFNSFADGFLNIGGIANISFHHEKKTHAFDICPGNIPLNYLMNSIGKSFDNNGELASKGIINPSLLEILNHLDFYNLSGPKSLGIEWINSFFLPEIQKSTDSIENKLATIVEHIAQQIAHKANLFSIQKLLITGGGALNLFLVQRISLYFNGEIIVPSKEIIEFKEAIIFGFLGALYLTKQENCLKDVTGASRNSCSGVLHLPN